MFGLFTKISFSSNPGCFERHLQRRYKNLLFPPDRQEVSNDELKEARQKDKQDKIELVKSHILVIKNNSLNEFSTADEHIKYLKELDLILKREAEVGGINKEVSLQALVLQLIETINSRFPEYSETITKVQALSYLERIPIMAQLNRPDTPIRKNEELASMLSEDLKTIEAIAIPSGLWGPNYKPAKKEVLECLQDAVSRGFNRSKFDEILKAWRQGELEGVTIGEKGKRGQLPF